jgi:hypothetical protein
MYVVNGKYRILTPLTKEQKRELKGHAKAGIVATPVDPNSTIQEYSSPIDCACVIHGNGYDWKYVDNLYSMLCRYLTRPVRMHVYTESTRSVPAPYIKHNLIDWKITGPTKSWWYKVQLFNSDYYRGSLLYFDLDVVITRNIDWIWKLKTRHFWAVKDFKYLWRPAYQAINSSIMWWDTVQYDWVWRNFLELDLAQTVKRFHGDQDYINSVITEQQRRYFNPEWVKSWRWQCLDGGYDFKRRTWQNPGSGTTSTPETSIMVFHGDPKPEKVNDLFIKQHWQ